MINVAKLNVVVGLNKPYNLQQSRPPERKSTMKTYVACIGEEAGLAFRAENDDEAQAMIDDEQGSMPGTA